MATIYVDNQPYEVEDGQNLLQACLGLGFNLPYFCWHPAMGSVGACRQCAVKQFRDEKDTRGRLVMACMTPATNNTRISIEDPDARGFRQAVIEWLMLNHPHDCPVCDEGGECHLQDMTVMTGHDYRRTRFPKRTYRDQDLGPFVTHEMNRCIQCYRCVRFYRDYAGGRDFDVFGIHNDVYFGRAEDGVLESEFAGNLVEVCPTGVFTDKTLARHYTRKWDFSSAPSVCVHCGLGCNTIPDERYGDLRRIRNRFNGQVNGYFLCDRGRYGYEFVNSGARIRTPLIRGTATAETPAGEQVTASVAVERIGRLIAEGARVIGIGSPRASLEANFALRTLVGADHFYQGMAPVEGRLIAGMLDIWRAGPAGSPAGPASLLDVRQSDAVLVLGEDVNNVAPMLALALRQSIRRQPEKIAFKLHIAPWDDNAVREVVQDQKGPLFAATVAPTRLDELATGTYHAAADDLARLGFAVADALAASGAPGEAPGEGSSGPLAGAIDKVAAALGRRPLADLPEPARALAGTIAAALRGADRPLVVAGPSLGHAGMIEAAANVAWALTTLGRPAALAFTVPECNSLGLAMLGGRPLDEAFAAVQQGLADVVVILENDLFRRAPAAEVEAFLAAAPHVVVLDTLMTPTAQRAEFVLPAGTFAESDGTFVNNEGRAQRFYQVFAPQAADIQESWRWLREVMLAAGRRDVAGWRNFDAVVAALAAAEPALAPAAEIAPPSSFRIAGMKIARQPHRATGRTAIRANISVSEPKPPDDPDSPFSFTMEGYQGDPPSPLIPRFWAPGWNSIQSLNKFQAEVPGPLRGGDPGRRLIEAASGAAPKAFDAIPAAFEPRPGEWQLAPLYHIYGSEELSVLAPGIKQLSPQPYAALGSVDAERLGLGEGQEAVLAVGGNTWRLPLRIVPGLAEGVVGIPAGMGLPVAGWARVTA